MAWDKYPTVLKLVSFKIHVRHKNTAECLKKAFFTIRDAFKLALSVPPGAILSGFLIVTSYVTSSVVTVPGTDCVEPVLVWLTVSMPTGSRKTTVYQFLRGL